MLDFICNGSVDLFGTGRERKIQNENICLQRDSNPRPASPRQESCSALDRISLLSDEIREDKVAKKLRMRHKRAVLLSDEPQANQPRTWQELRRKRYAQEKCYTKTREYDTIVSRERCVNDTKVTLIWHRKSTFESSKMEQVDQLLLLQAAFLEDIITVTNGVVAHVRGRATF